MADRTDSGSYLNESAESKAVSQRPRRQPAMEPEILHGTATMAGKRRAMVRCITDRVLQSD